MLTNTLILRNVNHQNVDFALIQQSERSYQIPTTGIMDDPNNLFLLVLKTNKKMDNKLFGHVV